MLEDYDGLDACLSSLFASLRNMNLKVRDKDAKESIDISLLAGFINKRDTGSGVFPTSL